MTNAYRKTMYSVIVIDKDSNSLFTGKFSFFTKARNASRRAINDFTFIKLNFQHGDDCFVAQEIITRSRYGEINSFSQIWKNKKSEIIATVEIKEEWTGEKA